MSIELKTRALENIESQKPVCLPEEYALKLKRLATTFAVTETSLLQEALDLLFQRDFEADTLTGWEYLDEMEAEFGPLPPSRLPAKPINPDEITETVEIRIAPEKIIRRNGAKI